MQLLFQLPDMDNKIIIIIFFLHSSYFNHAGMTIVGLVLYYHSKFMHDYTFVRSLNVLPSIISWCNRWITTLIMILIIIFQVLFLVTLAKPPYDIRNCISSVYDRRKQLYHFKQDWMDLSAVQPRLVHTSLNTHNIIILENHGLNSASGFWWLHFTFDHGLEKSIEVRLTNFKYGDRHDWTFEIVKCSYLGIASQEQMASFDMVDEFVNAAELSRLVESTASSDKLRQYLEDNMVPIVTSKIKYTKFKPQFRFFLSHKSKDKPMMRTFRNGLRFLGYDTWLDEVDIPVGANLQAALKTSIERCDCFIAWLNDEYWQSDYCKAELLYAKKLGKIILPFGEFKKIKEHLTGEFQFLCDVLIFDPTTSSFFEILRRIDSALFNFEKMAF